MSDATPTIDPRRTALLVMDYQAGILQRLPEPDALLARARAAIDIVRRIGGHVGYVRVAFEDADLQAIPARSAMARVLSMGRALHVDSPATAIDESMAPEPGDILIRKTRVGAFRRTDLEEQLQARGIETLLLAGISTSGVVLSTVRDGADRDYRLLVISDASADPEPGVHEFLIERILPRQARVVTTDELPALLAAPD